MVLRSWQEIAAYLHRGIRTVQRWEVTLEMPVHRDASNPRCLVVAFQHELDAWMADVARSRRARDGSDQTPVVLNTWKEIAAHLHRGVRTVQRWEATLGMPVRRLGTTPRAPVLAFQNELDAWRTVSIGIRLPPGTQLRPRTPRRLLSKAGTSVNVEQVDFGFHLKAGFRRFLGKAGRRRRYNCCHAACGVYPL